MKKVILKCSRAAFDFSHFSGNSTPNHIFQKLCQGSYNAFQHYGSAWKICWGCWAVTPQHGDSCYKKNWDSTMAAASNGAELLCNTAILGVKHLNAPYFPIFRWQAGVSAVNGEPPGEAVKDSRLPHSSILAVTSQELDVSLFCCF